MPVAATKRAGTRRAVAKKKPVYAKGITRKEFFDVMKYFVTQAQAFIDIHLREHPGSPLQLGDNWSYDNPSIHDADLAQLGITELNRAPLPPQSGDMHKVVEHVHATLCTAMSEWVARNPNVTKSADIKQQFEALFFKHITPAHVKKDIDSLPAQWRAIKANEGGWTPVKYRWVLVGSRGGCGGSGGPLGWLYGVSPPSHTHTHRRPTQQPFHLILQSIVLNHAPWFTLHPAVAEVPTQAA